MVMINLPGHAGRNRGSLYAGGGVGAGQANDNYTALLGNTQRPGAGMTTMSPQMPKPKASDAVAAAFGQPGGANYQSAITVGGVYNPQQQQMQKNFVRNAMVASTQNPTGAHQQQLASLSARLGPASGAAAALDSAGKLYAQAAGARAAQDADMQMTERNAAHRLATEQAAGSQGLQQQSLMQQWALQQQQQEMERERMGLGLVSSILGGLA